MIQPACPICGNNKWEEFDPVAYMPMLAWPAVESAMAGRKDVDYKSDLELVLIAQPKICKNCRYIVFVALGTPTSPRTLTSKVPEA